MAEGKETEVLLLIALERLFSMGLEVLHILELRKALKK